MFNHFEAGHALKRTILIGKQAAIEIGADAQDSPLPGFPKGRFRKVAPVHRLKLSSNKVQQCADPAADVEEPLPLAQHRPDGLENLVWGAAALCCSPGIGPASRPIPFICPPELYHPSCQSHSG